MKPLRLLRLLRINKTTGGGTHWPAKVLHNIAQHLVRQAPGQTEQFWRKHLSINLQLPTKTRFFLVTHFLDAEPCSERVLLQNTNMDPISNYSHLRFIFLIPWKLSHHQTVQWFFFSSFSKVKVEWEKKTGSHWHDIGLLRTLGYLKKKSKTTFHGQFWN